MTHIHYISMKCTLSDNINIICIRIRNRWKSDYVRTLHTTNCTEINRNKRCTNCFNVDSVRSSLYCSRLLSFDLYMHDASDTRRPLFSYRSNKVKIYSLHFLERQYHDCKINDIYGVVTLDKISK